MVKYDEKGLAPAVVQDERTGEVLMLGYVNETALQRTLQSGRAWFYSRSRQEYWLKGETSGNFLNVKSVLIDCDMDAIIYLAAPMGPTCHTGERSCFYRALNAEGELIPAKERPCFPDGGVEEDVREELRNRRGSD